MEWKTPARLRDRGAGVSYSTIYYLLRQIDSFPVLFSLGRGSFSPSRLRVYTTAQAWVPAGLRGACSGPSKSRNLASYRGEGFRPVRAKKAYGTPKLFPSPPPFFHRCCWLLFLEYRSSAYRQGSHGAPGALQAFPFVAPTNGATARV